VHLVRNALSHGCETPDEREAAGKPRAATLEIAASECGGDVVVEVRDDGRGVDAERVAAHAAERGLLDPAQGGRLDLDRALEVLFAPGFSTAAAALPLAAGIAGLGGPDARVTGVLVPVAGDIPALVLAVFPAAGAARLCELLGVAGEDELGPSALAEASNILATHYLGSLNAM